MELATKQDLLEMELNLSSRLDKIINLLEKYSITPSVSMTIADVRQEYKVSEYTQRMARNKGDLPYRMEGFKDLKYSRKDVEHWIERKTIGTDL